MEREIAHVMAACGMRGIRYISFPPIVFETPAPAPLSELPAEAEVETDTAPPPVELPVELVEIAPAGMPAPIAAAPALPPAAVAPMAAPVAAPAQPLAPAPAEAPAAPERMALPIASPALRRRLAEFATVTQEAPAPQGPRRRIEEWAEAPLIAAHHAPLDQRGEAPPRQSFALLRDIAGEVPARRVRARTGRRTPDKTA